jgi:hypothetical protein
MPRAGLLSIHARVAGTDSTTWEDDSLIQIWGPRYNAYVIAARDLAVFTLGRLPDDPGARRTAEDLAARLHALLDGARMSSGEVGALPRCTPQRAQVRRAHGHGGDALGWRSTAIRLDRAATGGRSE